jgi:Ca-activated chloride channel family protein
MRINTMFPSKSEGGENKGGIVVLKLKKISLQADDKVYLKTTYEDRNGRTDSSVSLISLESEQPEYFDNSGIRKAILLSRYAALIKNWLIDERQHVQYSSSWNPIVREDTGIVLPNENISQWERSSISLRVSSPYRMIFRDFADYFESEMRAINDYDLDQELAILRTLGGYR